MLNKRFSSGFTRHGILMPRSWNGELNLSIQGGRFHRGLLNGMGSAFRHGQTELPIERFARLVVLQRPSAEG